MAKRYANYNPGITRQQMLAAAGIKFRQAFAQNFIMGGRPTWVPLAQSTMRQKMTLYFSGRIRGRNVRTHLVSMRNSQPKAPGALFTLIRSGALRNSVVRRNSAGNITRMDASAGTLELGTSIFYGFFLEYGTIKMPARPFLTVPPEDTQEIMDIMAAMVLDADTSAPGPIEGGEGA